MPTIQNGINDLAGLVLSLDSKLEERINRVDNKLDVIGERTAKIEEHLSQLNNRVYKNEKICLDNKGKILLATGGLIVLYALLVLGVSIFIGVI